MSLMSLMSCHSSHSSWLTILLFQRPGSPLRVRSPACLASGSLSPSCSGWAGRACGAPSTGRGHTLLKSSEKVEVLGRWLPKNENIYTVFLSFPALRQFLHSHWFHFFAKYSPLVPGLRLSDYASSPVYTPRTCSGSRSVSSRLSSENINNLF